MSPSITPGLSLKSLKLGRLRNDILFIGGGVSVSHFIGDYQRKYGYKVYSSPLILIKDVVNKLK